jgi:hypothetical protein
MGDLHCRTNVQGRGKVPSSNSETLEITSVLDETVQWFKLIWTEKGGPTVSEPKDPGLGPPLITRLVTVLTSKSPATFGDRDWRAGSHSIFRKRAGIEVVETDAARAPKPGPRIMRHDLTDIDRRISVLDHRVTEQAGGLSNAGLSTHGVVTKLSGNGGFYGPNHHISG